MKEQERRIRILEGLLCVEPCEPIELSFIGCDMSGEGLTPDPSGLSLAEMIAAGWIVDSDTGIQEDKEIARVRFLSWPGAADFNNEKTKANDERKP